MSGERGPPVAKRDPSGASTVLKGERLRVPGASAADALAEVPGVQVSRAGAGSDLATASIRARPVSAAHQSTTATTAAIARKSRVASVMGLA